uniref:Uncharacterized protein n=1 Tax=Aegilops tauschii subsp. strangulata TaxID=200361 RepID=A0A453MRU3_AEGTS
ITLMIPKTKGKIIPIEPSSPSAAAMSRFVRRLAGIPWRQIAGEASSVGLLMAQGLCAVHVVSEHVLGVAFVRAPSPSPSLSRHALTRALSLILVAAATGPQHAAGAEHGGGRAAHRQGEPAARVGGAGGRRAPPLAGGPAQDRRQARARDGGRRGHLPRRRRQQRRHQDRRGTARSYLGAGRQYLFI